MLARAALLGGVVAGIAGLLSLPTPTAHLDLVLSGAVSTRLYLALPGDLLEASCTPGGFHFRSSPGQAPFDLQLTFKGAAHGNNEADGIYPLGNEAESLTLFIGTAPPYVASTAVPAVRDAFHAHEGEVYLDERGGNFSALAYNAAGEQLQLNGSFTCPTAGPR